MRVDIRILAGNFQLDLKELRDFALKNKDKYAIHDDGTYVTTITMFSGSLVNDFQSTLYTVNTPEGKRISVTEYMKTEDYTQRLEKQVSEFLTPERQQKLVDLFTKSN